MTDLLPESHAYSWKGSLPKLYTELWNFKFWTFDFFLLGSPHKSGYIYPLFQSSPLAQCSTATTCTIQTHVFVTSVPLWTEAFGGRYGTWTCYSFFCWPKQGLNPRPAAWRAGILPLSPPPPHFFFKMGRMYMVDIITFLQTFVLIF